MKAGPTSYSNQRKFVSKFYSNFLCTEGMVSIQDCLSIHDCLSIQEESVFSRDFTKLRRINPRTRIEK